MVYNAGLVLEGGGMRGIFTAGVLDFFMEKEILFTECIGVSAGACHACSYLSGQKGRAFKISVDYLGDKRYCGAHSFLTTGDIFGVDFIYRKIPDELNLYDYQAFLHCPTRFYAVVTNCVTGEPEYLRVQDMKRDIDAVRASSSLPLFSRMVSLGGKLYLDGGISDSIPVMRSIQNGNPKTVVVLTQHKEYQKSPDRLTRLSGLKYRKYPKLYARLKARAEEYNRTTAKIAELEKSGEIFVIRPPQKLEIERIDKDRARLERVYQIGYEQAKRQYEDMICYLEKARCDLTTAGL